MKQNTLLTIAAVAAGIAIVSKRKQVSGVGATNTHLALQMIRDAGMDIHQDFHALSFSQISELLQIMKRVKYKAPSGSQRNGSPARYFWYYMQRVADRSGIYGTSFVSIPDYIIAYWKELVHNNEHTEVLRSIAVFFSTYSDEFDKYVSWINDMIKSIEHDGYLTQYMLKQRNDLTSNLLGTIRSTFGDSVAKQVYNCL